MFTFEESFETTPNFELVILISSIKTLLFSPTLNPLSNMFKPL